MSECRLDSRIEWLYHQPRDLPRHLHSQKTPQKPEKSQKSLPRGVWDPPIPDPKKSKKSHEKSKKKSENQLFSCLLGLFFGLFGGPGSGRGPKLLSGDFSDSVKRHLRGRHLSVLNLKFDFISDGGCTREEQIALSLKRHLFPHGGREPKAFWICFSRVHPPSEIK